MTKEEIINMLQILQIQLEYAFSHGYAEIAFYSSPKDKIFDDIKQARVQIDNIFKENLNKLDNVTSGLTRIVKGNDQILINKNISCAYLNDQTIQYNDAEQITLFENELDILIQQFIKAKL